ncbi:Asp-tRNA(Asn)/Glu-tRNA(Gln) amidotransferase subunit GatA [Truepera radiovictrix]|uniref:Asp-tRNA(Asn)/Glu-tRNA(Gln) amidotransferase subunit GatA n=1 Tax=Truepera radiovictrix TaxID=332249 RepID=UPI0005A55692|nr:Asp-tRNA(Asn)/Glu-tRNA(Gln) amidotransferase subunit GatA [Truepera radiovictrix]WMT57933.1 Asp-tRNA(Asn)/Glu-tRNA(Gln) amidotransferase subunit GatA [Truepera radiovictrix]
MTLACDIAEAVGSGRERAETVVRRALSRADRVQRETNAFITLCGEAALARARALDARLAAGEAPPPLAGVPVAVKDNLCTRGVRTTAGSRSLEHFVPPFDATVVARLEAAGAVVIGKTNLDEFGMGSTNEHSAFGPVRNPWDLERVPGGSSGGSAVAVAAGVVPLALGTDTGGSVRQPASFTGVLGFKPTYGVLSRSGVIAFASSLDQVGVFGRSARDLALALTAMAGPDPLDATSLEAPPLSADLGTGTELSGLRVGLIKELSGAGNSPEVREALGRTTAALRDLGAEVSEVSLPHAPYGTAAYYIVAPAEASSNLARFDGMVYSRRVGESRLGQGEVMRRSRGALFGPEVRRRILVGTYALSAGYYEAFYGKALKVRRLIADEVRRAFGRFDLLLTPTAPSPAYRLGEVADPLRMYLGDVDTVLANLVGCGAVSVPAPTPGLPCGVQFLAPPLEDARLLRVAGALEAAAAGAFAPLAPAYR